MAQIEFSDEPDFGQGYNTPGAGSYNSMDSKTVGNKVVAFQLEGVMERLIEQS